MGKLECADEVSASIHLDMLINEKKILTEICTIRKRQHLNSVRSQLEDYKFIDVSENDRLQNGQLWLLTGRNENELKALNAGQSRDIRNEIEYDVGIMYGSVSGKRVSCPYKQLKKDYDELTFYEVDIDSYIKMLFGSICECDGIVKIMFEMSKEYMAEAAIAYRTAAEYWNFNRSGMDKKAYYRILDMPEILGK